MYSMIGTTEQVEYGSCQRVEDVIAEVMEALNAHGILIFRWDSEVWPNFVSAPRAQPN
jgi:hypothetical protein